MLLGQASALLGVTVGLGWMLAFALVFPHRSGGWSTGPQLLLPLEPPLIGFALGALGLYVARWSREPIARYSAVGLALNLLPLVLAVLLLVMSRAR